MRQLFILFCLYFFVQTGFAQKHKIKYGKVSDDEVKMTVYDKDTSAVAVYLADKQFSSFYYNNVSESGGFAFRFDRHVRIKIFKKEGYDYANFQIPVYHSGDMKEKTAEIKGVTYNIVDGKVVKTKFSRKDIFHEKVNENWDNIKFAMPDVKEGSVVEIKYSITSDFLYNLRDWKYQFAIPCAYSSYDIIIPEFFNYKINQLGGAPVHENTEGNTNETFTIRYKSTPQPGGHVDKGQFDLPSNSRKLHYATWDVPALIDEPHVSSIDFFRSRIEFELRSIKYPGQAYKNYAESWASIGTRLLEHSDFGVQYTKTRLVKDVVENITASATTDVEKAVRIFSYVKHNYIWNGRNSIYIDNVREVIKNKKGDAGDLNHLMLIMLKAAGIEAHPVILSTRSHGLKLLITPSMSSCNYVVAAVKLGDNYHLADATAPNSTFDILPQRCLNQKGRIIAKNLNQWIDLMPKKLSYKTYSFSLSLNEEGELSGNLQVSYTGNYALESRDYINKSKTEDKLDENIHNFYPNFDIEEYSIVNLDSLHKPLSIKYKIIINDAVNIAGNTIFFSPLFNLKMEENPFKTEERSFPVDYAFPTSKKIIAQINLPEGYMVEESPKSARFALPNKNASFSYILSGDATKLMLSSALVIKDAIFSPADYGALKEFYNQMINKHAEQIVLKKQ